MCGIAGAIDVPNASDVVQRMLKKVQARGQQSAKILSLETTPEGGRVLHEHGGFGWVKTVFHGIDLAKALPGTTAIGHVRYQTAGDGKPNAADIQPLTAFIEGQPFALAHNGNLTNFGQMREALEAEGAIFTSTSDSELFLHLYARTPAHLDAMTRLYQATRKVQGAYSLLLLSPEGMVAAVDPYGFRPLVVAAYKGGYLIASEECAFRPFPEVTEVTHLRRNSLWLRRWNGCKEQLFPLPDPGYGRSCSFEKVYFLNPASDLPEGRSVQTVRKQLGRLLAMKETRLRLHRPDVVTEVPDSSNAMAAAYAAAIGAPHDHALIRSHDTGRTFIESDPVDRELALRMKFSVVRDVVRNKRVAVVDDSIVRGSTMRRIIKLLREAGAREVHVRIGSPPVIHPCFWGIDTPSRRDLIASKLPVEAIAADVGADSLEYLTTDDLLTGIDDPDGRSHCTTCFTCVPPTQEPLPPERLVRKP